MHQNQAGTAFSGFFILLFIYYATLAATNKVKYVYIKTKIYVAMFLRPMGISSSREHCPAA